MKRRSVALLAVALLAIGFAAGSLFGDRQPKMKTALAHLQRAQTDLKAATADKGGHRAKAMALVDQAIDEVKKGIAYDNKR